MIKTLISRREQVGKQTFSLHRFLNLPCIEIAEGDIAFGSYTHKVVSRYYDGNIGVLVLRSALNKNSTKAIDLGEQIETWEMHGWSVTES